MSENIYTTNNEGLLRFYGPFKLFITDNEEGQHSIIDVKPVEVTYEAIQNQEIIEVETVKY